jgi:hypothetical protein
MISPEVKTLVLAGDIERAQAVSFVDDAIEKAENAQDRLFAIRLRWLRKYLITNAAMIAQTNSPEVGEAAGRGSASPAAFNSTKEPIEMDAMCKGSWSLGTACGQCSRCADTALDGARALQTEMKRIKPLADHSSDEETKRIKLILVLERATRPSPTPNAEWMIGYMDWFFSDRSVVLNQVHPK